jgi:hypothetical protein
MPKSFNCLVKRRVVASENPMAGLVADYLAARDQAEAEEIVAVFYRTNADAEELARAVLGEVLAEMSAPASAGLPEEHADRLRGPGGNKAFVAGRARSRHSKLGPGGRGGRGVSELGRGGGALCLPGDTSHILIRPRPGFGRRRKESCGAVTERDPRTAAPTQLPDR